MKGDIYIHKMEYYLIIKSNTLLIHVITWMNFEKLC